MPSLSEILGHILYVDLSTGQHQTQPIDEEIAHQFLGGWGISAWLAYRMISPQTEPLSPENPIIFGAGLLGGTMAPTSSKFMATTKFPITRTIGTSVGGTGGDSLRLAGYSQVVVSGQAEGPTLLRIFDDEVALEDASWLWGKDIAEVTDMVRARYGHDCSVVCIGPAGENQVGVSMAFVNHMGHLGQGGLGAIMGYKNLKAVVIRGTGSIAVADRKEFQRLSDQVHEAMLKLPYRPEWLEIGPGIAAWGYRARRPKLTPEQEAADVYGPTWYDKIYRGPVACPSCPLACKHLLEIREGEHAGLLALVTGAGSGWDKFNTGNTDHSLVLREYCNRMGIDDSETTAVIDWAIKCYQAGIITKEDTGGLELGYNYATAETLLHQICAKEGLGKLLADGLGEAVKRIGRGSEKYAALLKNRAAGVSSGDGRLHFQPMTMTEVVNPRGYNAVPSNGPGFMPGHPPETFRRYLRTLMVPEEEIAEICSDDNVNMALVARHAEDKYGISTSLGICTRQPVGQTYTPSLYAQFYAAMTGIVREPKELMQAGERIWNLIKAANVREGFTRADDAFDEKQFEPLELGGQTYNFKDYYGHPLDKAATDALIDGYYQSRGWDPERGMPTVAKLEELGLHFVVEDLAQAGVLVR